VLARAAPQLRSLTLTACDDRALHGAPLRCFPRLRSLIVSSCPALRCESLVHALVTCPQLLLLRLPVELHLQLSRSLPVRAPAEQEEEEDHGEGALAPWRPPHLLRLDASRACY
jgi:hypothetical protein